MTVDKKIARIRSRSNVVRKIARGIYDKAERRIVLKFVTDAEKLLSVTAQPSGGESDGSILR